MDQQATSHETAVSAWAYVAPMAAFLALTALEPYLPKRAGQLHPVWYTSAYVLKLVIVAAVAWCCRAAWRDLRPWPDLKASLLAIGLGAAIAALWVGLDGWYPSLSAIAERSQFDPTRLPLAAELGFLAARLFGLVLLVPLIEELFWRSFLMRWIIDPNFNHVAIGRVMPAAAAITSILFALEHPEWLPGLLAGLAWAWLVWRTRSVSACVLSHAAANLGLGLYVVSTGSWRFW